MPLDATALARETENRRSLEQRGSVSLGTSTLSATVITASVAFLAKETAIEEARYTALVATLCYAAAAVFALFVVTDTQLSSLIGKRDTAQGDIVAENQNKKTQLVWVARLEVAALVLLAVTAWLIVF